MSNQNITVIHRLSAEVYLDLEKRYSKPVVTSQTTAHEAGYQLGVQAILQELRRGYVVQVKQ